MLMSQAHGFDSFFFELTLKRLHSFQLLLLGKEGTMFDIKLIISGSLGHIAPTNLMKK